MIEATQAKTSSKSILKPVPAGTLQRKCACGTHTLAGAQCEECGKQKTTLQRKAGKEGEGRVPANVHDVVRSSGEPLDKATRSFFEPRLGQDFSHVRLHTDARAAESASAVNALAYTVGNDVVFGASQYAPGTSAGRRLLAHELTHVMQQQGSSSPAVQRFSVGPTDDPAEREADSMAESAAGEVPSFGALGLTNCVERTADGRGCRQVAVGENAPPESTAASEETSNGAGRAPGKIVVPLPPMSISAAKLLREIKVSPSAPPKAVENPRPYEGPLSVEAPEQREAEQPKGTPEGPEELPKFEIPNVRNKPSSGAGKPRFDYGLKGGGKYGVGSSLRDPAAEHSGTGEVTAEASKPGVFANALTLGLTGMDKPLLVFEAKYEAMIPFWELMTPEDVRKKFRGWGFLKEQKFGVGLATQILNPERQVLTNAIFEYTTNAVSYAWENKRKRWEIELGLSPFGRFEMRPGAPVVQQHGLEFNTKFKRKLPGIGRGRWYFYVELPVRVYGTFEGLQFQGNSVSFTPYGGTGINF